MGKIVRRLFHLDLPPRRSAFLWGPRKVGKSYWIQHHLPDATVLDFLKTEDLRSVRGQMRKLYELNARCNYTKYGIL